MAPFYFKGVLQYYSPCTWLTLLYIFIYNIFKYNIICLIALKRNNHLQRSDIYLGTFEVRLITTLMDLVTHPDHFCLNGQQSLVLQKII